MAAGELQELVSRRLRELGSTPAQASRRCGGRVPTETIRGLLRGQRSLQLGDALAAALAVALALPEQLVRRAADLPVGQGTGASVRPTLRLVTGEL